MLGCDSVVVSTRHLNFTSPDAKYGRIWLEYVQHEGWKIYLSRQKNKNLKERKVFSVKIYY